MTPKQARNFYALAEIVRQLRGELDGAVQRNEPVNENALEGLITAAEALAEPLAAAAAEVMHGRAALRRVA